MVALECQVQSEPLGPWALVGKRRLCHGWRSLLAGGVFCYLTGNGIKLK